MQAYILDELGNPVPEKNSVKWALWFQNADRRRIASSKVGKVIVSTIFLGIDHSFGDGPPVLWETMVFGGELDESTDRCSGSREQAEAMHAEVVERVKSLIV